MNFAQVLSDIRAVEREEAKEPAMNARLLRKINTEYVCPPVPFRHMDWSATFEGYEPGESIGTGATEQEAIDWLIAEEAHLIATAHSKVAA